ncbi:Aladin [Armadillidium nasatum]|uniref:Aladin n=1 Tax=Armadillidium nasatum TaxID=96803 RepID=A0A5N5TA60_9CRUS|nr:Aladin [Armadillidium nasatum]
MLTLQHFSSPPPKNKITVCENEGQLRSHPLSEAKQKMLEWLGNYNIDVHIGQENARSAYSKYDAKDAFSAHTETLWQRFIAAYYEEGFLIALRHIPLEERDINPLLRKGSLFILKLVENFQKAKHYLSSPSRAPSVHSLDSSFIQASSKLVVNLAWHPHTPTLAVVYADDTIRVFGKNRSLTPLLKHRMQKNISQVQWMPYCASILAVGCQSGTLLWTLDPVSVVTRPSGSCLSLLAHQAALPLTSLSWHPKGITLASVGGKGKELNCLGYSYRRILHSSFWNCNLYIYGELGSKWKQAIGRHVNSCYQVSFVLQIRTYVKNQQNWFLMVFETRNWSFERWSLSFPLQSAVWASNGRILLFVTTKEPFLFCLTFSDEQDGVGGALVATQVADLSATVVPCEDGDEVRGFIKGEPGQIPIHISFQNNVSNGAVLTTVWSGGEVNHLPLRYISHEYRDIGTFSQQNRSYVNTPPSPSFNQSHVYGGGLGPSFPMRFFHPTAVYISFERIKVRVRHNILI